MRLPGIIVKFVVRLGSLVVFAVVAIVASGCSDSRLAANDAASASARPQPSGYQAGYGLTSDGPTTDLYHEFKHSLEPPERPQATAAVQQPAPVDGQPVADSRTSVIQQGVAQPAGTQPAPQQPVAQQPVAPPREAPTATMYGMNSDGPSTDIYTAIFGR